MSTGITTDLALDVEGLGKRYRRGAPWALHDCTFQLPAGRVAALVGHNGAGKTTLLSILSGLLAPSEGTVRTQGRVRFVAQEKPLYRQASVATMLRLTADLNRLWDQDKAVRWLRRFEIPLDRPCGKLSGGQQAQVALALVLGARPTMLLLDEPLASLDPLARQEVTRELLGEVTDTGLTLLLSTHTVTDLAGVADHLLLLGRGSLLVNGDVDELLAAHWHYIGPRADAPPAAGEVVRASHTDRQSTFLVRLRPHDRPAPVAAPWVLRPLSLEEFVVAQLEISRMTGREAAA